MSCSGGLAPGSSLTPLTACQLVSGICQTLVAEGASDQDLLDVASGCMDDTALLTELMSGYKSPVVVTSSATDIVLGSLGAAGDSVSNAVSDVVNPIGNAITSAGNWLKSNWLWIVGILLAGLLLVAWAYGGFRLGFLQG